MAGERSSLFYLPEALEEEILVRLSVKSISRLKSVCKRWYSLVRSNTFTEFYFGHHQVSIPTKKDLCLIYPELRTRSRRRCCGRRCLMWAIGPSSNGIYALISIVKNMFRENLFLHTLKIALFNPATRRLEFAAPFPDEYLPRLTGISPNDSYVSCGIDDNYRVVVLISYESRSYQSSFMAFLYTWRTGEWELLVDYIPDRRQFGLQPGSNVFRSLQDLMEDRTACPQKLLNGCWHWLTVEYDLDKCEHAEDLFTVLSFDFERKSFGLISGPQYRTGHADVFVLKDHLAVIVFPHYQLGVDPELQIWMKTNATETIWTNIYRVNPILDLWYFLSSILYGVDYYQEQEEPELIRIKSVKLLTPVKYKPFTFELFTFDDKGGHQESEEKQDSDQIPLSLAGISAFRPTLEPLPGSSKVLEQVGLNASILTEHRGSPPG